MIEKEVRHYDDGSIALKVMECAVFGMIGYSITSLADPEGGRFRGSDPPPLSSENFVKIG
jgi:hypothetical protein